jgi:hypothetical protein
VNSFAFIYGVQNPGALDQDGGVAFVVAIRAGEGIIEARYDPGAIDASKQTLDVRIGASRAQVSRIHGEIRDGGDEAGWDLALEPVEIWTDTMGALTNHNRLPINWYVGALRGRADGVIEWNGERFEFTDAEFFQDKNWGDVFPPSYVWLQSSSFDDPNGAFAFAGGPIGGLPVGMFVWRDGDTLHEARSQDGDTWIAIAPEPENERVTVTITRAKRQFVLTGLFWRDDPVTLPAPAPAGFLPYSQMAIAGRVQIELFERNEWDWELVKKTAAEPAGVEIGGGYLAN